MNLLNEALIGIVLVRIVAFRLVVDGKDGRHALE
jgi:hypothetical protein